MRAQLLSLCLLTLGCDSLWQPYRGNNSDHCAINPAVCSSAQVCNPETGRCEDPGKLLPQVVLADCKEATLLAALNMPDEDGFELVLPPNCSYRFTAPNSYWYGPSALPAITKAIAIDGNGAIFQGAGTTTPFRFAYVAGLPPDFVGAGPGRLILRNLTLSNFAAVGGSGGNGSGDTDSSCGGGGGAGLGGALFVQGTAELYSVTLISNSATGGNGNGNGGNPLPSYGGGGGGGGLGASGANGSTSSVGGGGGGFRYPGCETRGDSYDGNGGGFNFTCQSLPSAGEGGSGGSVSCQGGKGLPGSSMGASVQDSSAGGAGGGSSSLGGAGGAAYVSGAATSLGGAAGDGGGGGAGSVLTATTAAGGGGGGGFAGGGGGSSFAYIGTTSGGGGGGGFGGGGGGGTNYSGGGGGGIGGGGGGGGRAQAASENPPDPETPSGGGGGGFGGGGGGGTSGGDGGFGGGGGGFGGDSRFGGGTGAPVGSAIAGSGGGMGAGGAIFVHQGKLIAVNSSLIENTARGGSSGRGATPASGLGGAIFNLSGSVDLYNVTIAANQTATATTATAAKTEGGAIYNLSLGGSEPLTALVTLRNSILAQSQTGSPIAHDLYNDTAHSKGAVKVRADDSNWVGQADGANNIPSQGSPELMKVTDASGVSYVPPAGSALASAGDPAICYSAEVAGLDQRGTHRHSKCTLGAIELSALEPAACQTAPGSSRARASGLLFLIVAAAGLLLRKRRAAILFEDWHAPE